MTHAFFDAWELNQKPYSTKMFVFRSITVCQIDFEEGEFLNSEHSLIPFFILLFLMCLYVYTNVEIIFLCCIPLY